jgi:capsular polysaccharide biosynthesis protein
VSKPRPLPDLDAEQEVDLRRWRQALVDRWWLPVVGLALGALVGLLLSVGGSQVYQAEALISLGQPFSPSGSAPVNSFATNPRAIAEIVRSESAIKVAARAAGLRPGQLRGKVTSKQVGAGTGTAARTAAPLIALSVQGAKPAKVEKAANKLADIVVERTTAPYVGTKIKTFDESLASIQQQLNSLAPRIKELEREVDNANLAPLDRLLLATQLDNAQQRRGQLLDLQLTTQQQLALAENVESAKVIQQASATKTTARSRRNSVLVGALIGLILGTVAAIVWDAAARPALAT